MPSLRAAGLDSRPVWVWDIPSSSRLSAARCDLRRQSMMSEPPLLVSSSEKQVRPGRLQFGAVRTAYANLQFVCSVDHALWADPWCTMSPGVVRRAARRSEMQDRFAVRVRLGQSLSGPASTCIEDPRVRTGSVAARSARPPRSYRVRHRRLELWTPPQERRGLCQAPDTRMWLNARKVEDETCSVFARKHTVGKVDTLPFRAAIGDPQAGLGRSSYPPDLESRSLTSFLGRICLTARLGAGACRPKPRGGSWAIKNNRNINS